MKIQEYLEPLLDKLCRMGCLEEAMVVLSTLEQLIELDVYEELMAYIKECEE